MIFNHIFGFFTVLSSAPFRFIISYFVVTGCLFLVVHGFLRRTRGCAAKYCNTKDKKRNQTNKSFLHHHKKVFIWFLKDAKIYILIEKIPTVLFFLHSLHIHLQYLRRDDRYQVHGFEHGGL